MASTAQVKQSALAKIQTMADDLRTLCRDWDSFAAVLAGQAAPITGASFLDAAPNATPPVAGDFDPQGQGLSSYASWQQSDVTNFLAAVTALRAAVTTPTLTLFDKLAGIKM